LVAAAGNPVTATCADAVGIRPERRESRCRARRMPQKSQTRANIDRIISRTLAYAIVTGLLVGVYAGLVLLATHVLSVHSTVAVAAATLAAAALFNPLRRRVQHLVDRRFNRARYDTDRIVAAFASRLKDEVDLDSIRDDLAGAVQRALEPAHASVWIDEQSHELQLPYQGRDGIIN
jgi:Flp pilus assembly protein TadB